MSDWITDSNDALTVTIKRDGASTSALEGDHELALVAPFHPTFTYAIFGEEQKIFGYKGLDIRLSMASGSLFQCLEIKYESKIESSATPADDIHEVLKEYLAPDHTTSTSTFDAHLAQDASSFRPFGKKIGSYTRPSGAKQAASKGKGKAVESKKRALNGGDEQDEGEVVYEMWKTSRSDEGFTDFHRRLQLFVLLCIEGGQYIQEDEDLWEFVVLYEKRRLPSSNKRPTLDGGESGPAEVEGSEAQYSYHVAGYTSLYPFYNFPDKTRLRLSQFIILPPYQNQGHGSALYSTLYSTLILQNPLIVELTIEDPSEAFEDLRDVCDLRYIEKEIARSAASTNGKAKATSEDWSKVLEAGVLRSGGAVATRAWGEERRKEGKFASRQFARVFEMLLFHNLDETDDEAVKAFRLFVKERLYRFNHEILSQMKPSERKVKLEETYESLTEDYGRILDRAFGALGQ